MGFEQKKLALFRIFEILKNETDINHTLTHNEISEKLSENYGIDLERKSVAANMVALNDLGYDIITNKKGGSYLNARDFEDVEIKLLIDAVIYSQYISEKHSKDLIEKLTKLSNKYFKIHNKNFLTLKNKYKTDNADVFYNMEQIDDAISNKKKIKYNYIKLNTKKEQIKDSEHIISPYGYVLHNQRYYLLGFSDKWKGLIFHRLEWIKEIKILDDKDYNDIKNIEDFKYGVGYDNLIISRPYMYTDKIEPITIKILNKYINDVYDWFGKDVLVKEIDKDFSEVILKASPMAMKLWALQYLDVAEVLSPTSLRKSIKDSIKKGKDKYK